MEIKGFSSQERNLRIGNYYPLVLDISAIQGLDGLLAAFDLHPSLYPHCHVELRAQANYFALIIFPWPDTELPTYWQDAEIIWSWPVQKGENGNA